MCGITNAAHGFDRTAKTNRGVMQANKLPLSAGAKWLLDAFALLRRSPTGLGLMGLMVGLITSLASLLSMSNAGVGLAVQFVMVLITPALIGALAWGAHAVDSGRTVQVGDLAQGFAQGRFGRLLLLLLPNLAVGLLAALLLMVLLGREQLEMLAAAFETVRVQAQSNPNAQPDPNVFAGINAGRLLVWMLAVLVLGMLANFCTLTAYADISVRGTAPMQAMRNSLHGCLANIPAVLVLMALMLMTAFGVMLLANILAMLVGAIFGPVAIALVFNTLMMGALLTLMAASGYFALKQMYGQAQTQHTPPPPLPGEFQA